MAVSEAGPPAFVQVRCPAGPFRRAGRAFGKEFTIIAGDELGDEEFSALIREPALEVQGSEDGETFTTLLAPVPEPVAFDPFEEADQEAREQRLARQVAELERELLDAQGRADGAQLQLDGARASIEGLEKAIAEKEAEIAELKQQLESCEGAEFGDEKKSEVAQGGASGEGSAPSEPVKDEGGSKEPPKSKGKKS